MSSYLKNIQSIITEWVIATDGFRYKNKWQRKKCTDVFLTIQFQYIKINVSDKHMIYKQHIMSAIMESYKNNQQQPWIISPPPLHQVQIMQKLTEFCTSLKLSNGSIKDFIRVNYTKKGETY